MPLVRVERLIAADPTSTALLLAGPAALDLWPGLERVGELDRRLRVVTELPGAGRSRRATVLVRALPPRRTPTAFVTRFGFAGEGLPDTDGLLTLAYQGRLGAPVATHAVLELRSAQPGPEGLHSLAAGFLANLAVAAEERAFAA